MSRVHVHSRSSTERCPLCHHDVGARARSCPECATRYHRACTEELGDRCAVLGCTGRLERPRPRRTDAGFLHAFDDRPPREELPGLLQRAWDQFSLVHFGCGVLVLVPLTLALMVRHLARHPDHTGYGVAIGLVLAVLAGFYQDRFWYALGPGGRHRW